MSIYATLWEIKFPVCVEWVTVFAQAVPGHIKNTGLDWDFLPPPIEMSPKQEAGTWPIRAVFFITEQTEKGTPRNGQEYINPLLMLTGAEYEEITFCALYERIRDALEQEEK